MPSWSASIVARPPTVRNNDARRPGPPPEAHGIVSDRLPAAGVVRRHQLAAFFVLAFTISWIIWLGLAAASLPITTTAGAVLNVLAIAGPSLAALLLTIGLGRGALRELLAGFSPS